MKLWERFFSDAGDTFLHPTSFGESHFSVGIEELYQMFKERLLDEMNDLSGHGSNNLEHRESIR